jgi:hypothetical protein
MIPYHYHHHPKLPGRAVALASRWELHGYLGRRIDIHSFISWKVIQLWAFPSLVLRHTNITTPLHTHLETPIMMVQGVVTNSLDIFFL